jgi:hypothetical protein
MRDYNMYNFRRVALLFGTEASIGIGGSGARSIVHGVILAPVTASGKPTVLDRSG